MKYVVLAFLATFTLVMQEPPEFAEGVFCSPAGIVSGGKVVDADHPCFCKNMASPTDSCEKPITNDPQCTQFCHEKHCSCPLMCGSSMKVRK